MCLNSPKPQNNPEAGTIISSSLFYRLKKRRHRWSAFLYLRYLGGAKLVFEPREAVGSDPAPGLTRIGGQGPWAPGPRMTVYAPERAGASRWQRRATPGAVPLTSPPPPAPGHFPLPSPLSRQSSPRRQPRGPSPQKPLPKRFRYGLPQTSLRAPRKATGKASFLQSPFTPEAPPDRDIYASLVLPEFGKGRGAQPRGEKWGEFLLDPPERSGGAGAGVRAGEADRREDAERRTAWSSGRERASGSAGQFRG